MNLKNLLKKTGVAEKLEDVREKFDEGAIKELIKKFIESKKSEIDLDDNTDLFKNGYVNSLFALEIVTFIEKTFKIKLGKNDISKENFSSISKITSLVKKLSNK